MAVRVEVDVIVSTGDHEFNVTETIRYRATRRPRPAKGPQPVPARFGSPSPACRAGSLVIARHLLRELRAAVVLKDEKVTDQVEQVVLVEDARDHHLQLGQAGIG